MKPALIQFVARRFSASVNNSRFLSYTRLIAFLSVTVGTMALVIALAVLKGYQDTFNSVLSRFYSHIQVQPLSADAASRMLSPSFSSETQFSEIEFTAQSLEHEALIRCKGNIEGAFLKSWSNDQVLRHTGLISPDLFSCVSERKEVVLGKRLALNLSCGVGDTVVMITQPSRSFDSSPIVVKCRVAAILNTGMAQFDESLCLTTTSVMQTLMDNYGTPLYEVWTKEGTDNELLAIRIEEALHSGFYSRTIRQQERAATMFRWIEEQQVYIPIVLSLITIVAVFNIVTTLLISIVEKSRSYAILLTLGYSQHLLILTVVMQGVRIGVMASLTGCFLAFIVCQIQAQTGVIALDGAIYFVNQLPVSFLWIHYAAVLVASTILCFICSLIPALIVARLKPAQVLRFS